MKTNRNSPCTCGSGLKYKQCCGLKEGQKSRTLTIAGGLILGGLFLIGVIFVNKGDNRQPTVSGPVDPGAAGSAQPAAVPGSPQPAGPVPAGKVWSVEHGHWHDAPGAPGAAGQPSVAQPAAQPGPQPPGPVPPGKVWSVEHGHWHDAPPK